MKVPHAGIVRVMKANPEAWADGKVDEEEARRMLEELILLNEEARLERQKPPAALLAHYRDGGKLIDVNGLQPVEKVTEALLRAVHGTENGPK